MTQAVLRLWNGTTLDRDLNDGARYALDGEYAPGLPQLTEDELFDLVTPVTDEIPLHVIGCTRDELSDNLAALNTALYRAARYIRDRNQGSVRRLEFAPSGSKYTVWNDILGGSANWSGPVEGPPAAANSCVPPRCESGGGPCGKGPRPPSRPPPRPPQTAICRVSYWAPCSAICPRAAN